MAPTPVPTASFGPALEPHVELGTLGLPAGFRARDPGALAALPAVSFRFRSHHDVPAEPVPTRVSTGAFYAARGAGVRVDAAADLPFGRVEQSLRFDVWRMELARYATVGGCVRHRVNGLRPLDLAAARAHDGPLVGEKKTTVLALELTPGRSDSRIELYFSDDTLEKVQLRDAVEHHSSSVHVEEFSAAQVSSEAFSVPPSWQCKDGGVINVTTHPLSFLGLIR